MKRRSKGSEFNLEEWLIQLLDMGVRAEQQAFAVHDLNDVINDYLPQKLRKAKAFLP